MRAERPLQSPLLVGRDDLLALVDRRLAEANAGRGGLLLLAGEAGIGKTRLLKAAMRAAMLAGFRAAKGDVAPGDNLVPLASILDLGRSMPSATFRDLGPDLLRVQAGKGRDTLASRRILVHEIAELIAASVDRPTVLVFEDLQWADELSLEVIGELARLAADRSLLLLGAYRSDDLPSGSIHREWRARLLTQRLAEELPLARLTYDETALVTTLILGTGLPAPRDVAEAVQARTNGIPLHVEELLGALGDDVRLDGRLIREAAVPNTIEDAVLARLNRLGPDARAAARAGAVIGRCFPPEVLAGILDRPLEALDAPIEELVANAFLYPFEFVDRGYFDFRHQLLRDAIYETVPPGELRRLHARAAEFGADLVGASEIHASLHFERAGLRAQAFRAALAGAREASAVSSRYEAVELYRRAVANLPEGLSASELGDLYAAYCDAAMAIDDVETTEEAADLARRYFLEAGRPIDAAAALIWLANMARRDVRPRGERQRVLAQAESELLALPPEPPRDSVLADLRLSQAVLELDGARVAQARPILREARHVRAELGAPSDDIDFVEPVADIIEGRPRAGLDAMLEVARRCRESGLESPGVTAYRVAAAFAAQVMDYPTARVGLAEGLRYADEVEQSYCRSVLASTSAHVAWAAGQWDEAVQIAELELVERGSRRGRLGSREALAYVALGRGDAGRARDLLDESLAIARPGGVNELILPALWGQAEGALLAGDPARALDHCNEAIEIAAPTAERALLVPFVVTAVRSALASRRPEAAERWLGHVRLLLTEWSQLSRPAVDHAEGLLRLAQGTTVAARTSLEAAVAGWDALGRTWEANWARLDLAACLLRTSHFVEANRLIDDVAETARRLGSRPLESRATELRRLARGRGREEEPWHPLTVRELEVARHIAAGLTNAQIAAELLVSPKTVSAHVEHMLAKLGVSRRAEVAAWVTTVARVEPEPRPATEAIALAR